MRQVTWGVFFSALLLFVGPGQAEANVQGRDLGLGIGLGDPTGVNLKNFVGERNAFDVHVGFGAAWGRRLRLHADYLWHFPLTRSTVELDAYLGAGAKIGMYGVGRSGPDGRGVNLLTVGGRVPFGLALVPPDVPIDVFLEVAPGVRVVTGGGGFVGGFVDALLGVRYYF